MRTQQAAHCAGSAQAWRALNPILGRKRARFGTIENPAWRNAIWTDRCIHSYVNVAIRSRESNFEAFVKIYRSGFIYICAIGLGLAGSFAPELRAQQSDAALPATDPGGIAQKPATQYPDAQNPTTQNPTTQNPSAPAPAAQTPAQSPATPNPTTQNPTSQNPAQPGQPATAQPSSGPIVNAPPELPKYPDVRLPGEYGFYIGIDGWLPQQQPTFNKGRNSGVTNNSYITMQGTPKLAQGAEFGLALGLHNMLRLSYFQARASGDYTAPVDTTVFDGQTYGAGTLVSTDYLIQNIKLSFDYLTWPYPVESRRFRLKTLWQVQYVSARAGFDAPQLPLVDANGNPLVDASGNPISYAASESKWFILPTFGLSATEYLTPRIRLEASADGFAIPRHSTLYEGESTINLRVSHFEIRGGAKLFRFKTSTSQDFYMKGTLGSVFFGVRWYSR